MADQDLLKYPMNNAARGIAMIFAYKNFSHQQNFAERPETNLDCSQIEMRLKKSDFKVIKHVNKTKEATLSHIDMTLRNYSGERGLLSRSDCFIAVFLSYGADGVIFAQDSHMMFYEEILDRFNGVNCPSLIGKPKLFIVQASPVRYAEDYDAGLFHKPRYFKHMIPSEANTLIAWNPLPGIIDMRSERKNGSLFIQSFCENLRIYGRDTSMPTIVRKTIKKVCHILERDHPEVLEQYEYRVPYMINMLTKELTLTPKKSE